MKKIVVAAIAALVIGGTAGPADAGSRTYANEPKVSGGVNGRIIATGTVQAWAGDAKLDYRTQCQLQQLWNLGTRDNPIFSWVDAPLHARGLPLAVQSNYRTASYWTQPFEPGTYRTRCRKVAVAWGKYWPGKWVQSRAVRFDKNGNLDGAGADWGQPNGVPVVGGW